MPIRPENKELYPKDWKQIRAEIKDRALDKCEICGVQNHDVGIRFENGTFHRLDGGWKPGQMWQMTETKSFKVIRIVCTVMHLNHDPTDNGQPGNRPNLKFGCQRCHNKHDAAFRAANRKINKGKEPMKKTAADKELPMKRSAKISDCGQYRYTLRRNWQGPNDKTVSAAFIMLNPSTADHEQEDPTLKRCINFAKKIGVNDLLVVNLFALRSPDPAALAGHVDPVGPENAAFLDHAVKNYGTVILGWGSEPIAQARAEEFLAEYEQHRHRFQCFGKNKGGSPKHPLYLAAESKLVDFIDNKGASIDLNNPLEGPSKGLDGVS